MIHPGLIIGFIVLYFLVLLVIGWVTARHSNAGSYFLGNKQSPWYLVAFGMIGDSLSGVTFISVPGTVGTAHFSYLQLVFGYFFGYFIIAGVLLPMYYRLNLTSVYEYLEQRFGLVTQKTGSLFFIISRLLGAAGRLYLAATVIQFFVFDRIPGLYVPFAVSVSVILALMLLYTYRGGIKTLVYTDTFQSLFLVLGVLLSIVAIMDQMDIGLGSAISNIYNSEYSDTFHWDFMKGNFFFKEFLGGIFIAVTMTGLDQNMMQKNLSMRTIGEAQRNIMWFSVVMLVVTFCFLSLGALIYQYYDFSGAAMPLDAAGKVVTDKVFPNLALNHLGVFAGMVFIIGLTAATFSSADSVLTTLTTSAYIDLLMLDTNTSLTERKKQRIRTQIHIGFAVLMWLVIMGFELMNKTAIINTILMVAGYTYGPLLALFALGLFTKISLRDRLVPFACLIGPLLCFALKRYTESDPSAYQIGNELIVVNGILTFLCLLLVKSRQTTQLQSTVKK